MCNDATLKIAQGFEVIAVEVALVQGASNQESLGMVREATKRWLRNNGMSVRLYFLCHVYLLKISLLMALSSYLAFDS